MLGLALLGAGNATDDESPVTAMAIIVVVVMLIGVSVAGFQGQRGWHRVGTVGFVVGPPIGFVVTLFVLFSALIGRVGS